MPNSIASKPRKARTSPRPDARLAAAVLGGWWLLCALGPAQLSAALPARQLAGQSSAYLAQHADDPVHWQLWNDAAFARAAREQKLLLVSSGYFSCHWCHVMQRESFRDPHIAALINRHFIPVKIDRETLPALDAALLDFARRTRGQAGWPLQVFVTPEGYPLVAATYQPPQEFTALLDDLAARWKEQPGTLSATARAAAASVATPTSFQADIEPGALYEKLRTAALVQADELQGGFGAQSRFPHAPQLLALLRLYAQTPHADLGAFLRLTLRQMATQGLHDELGGGFFRYTTDPDWQTPHFEKLLADNALLARVYLRAAQVLGEPEWSRVAQDTLDFILRELPAAGGGYYTALSALDGAGVDGGYYVWSRAQLQELAGSHWPWLERYWGLDAPAPFAAGYLPLRRLSRAQLAVELKLPQLAVEAGLDALYTQLRRQRAQRVLPVDRQIPAAANGLLLTALAEAGVQVESAVAQRRYARAATELAQFLRREFWHDGRLVRARVPAAPPPAATLEDHAYVAEGLMSAYASADVPAGQRDFVRTLIGQAWARYYSKDGWRLGEDALLRWGGTELALADTAVPAAPAVLLRLTRDLKMEPRRSESALRAAWPAVSAAPFRHASYVGLYP